MVQLRYFASLRETLGTGDEQLELPGDINDLTGLTRWLQNRDDTWKQALSDTRLHVAINQQIVNTNAAVNDGDEVAWVPPVTGG
jgi:molybdopterin synthase sulfur carrier subunit